MSVGVGEMVWAVLEGTLVASVWTKRALAHDARQADQRVRRCRLVLLPAPQPPRLRLTAEEARRLFGARKKALGTGRRALVKDRRHKDAKARRKAVASGCS